MGSPRHRRGQSTSGKEKNTDIIHSINKETTKSMCLFVCIFVTERSLDSTVCTVSMLQTVISWVLFPAAEKDVSPPHALAEQYRCLPAWHKGYFTKLCCRILQNVILLLFVTLPRFHSHCVSGDSHLTKFQNYWSFTEELVGGLTCFCRRKNDVTTASGESKVLWCSGSLLTVCTVKSHHFIHCC
jgi:hypothetical protein